MTVVKQNVSQLATATASLTPRVADVESRAGTLETTANQLAGDLATASTQLDALDKRVSDLETDVTAATTSAAAANGKVGQIVSGALVPAPVTALAADVNTNIKGNISHIKATYIKRSRM